MIWSQDVHFGQYSVPEVMINLLRSLHDGGYHQ